MRLLKSRKKTTRSPRIARRNGDLQKLHIKVSSPRIVMLQVFSGLSKASKIIFVFAVIGLLAWAGYRGLNHAFLGNEKYKLQEIELQTNGEIDHARLVKETQIDLNASIFAINVDELKSQLNSLPEVIDCEVERRLPGTLKVKITERVPVIWIESEAGGLPGRQHGGVLADESGITFPCEGGMWTSARNLPIVVVDDVEEGDFIHGRKMKHTEVMRALHLIKTLSYQQVRAQWKVERVILVNDYSMEVVCNDGTHATFGMYDHERQVRDFASVCEDSLSSQRKIRHINLIPEKNIPVKFAGDSLLIQSRRTPVHVSSDVREVDSILDRN